MDDVTERIIGAAIETKRGNVGWAKRSVPTRTRHKTIRPTIRRANTPHVVRRRYVAVGTLRFAHPTSAKESAVDQLWKYPSNRRH